MAIVRKSRSAIKPRVGKALDVQFASGTDARQYYETLGLNNNGEHLFEFVSRLGIKLIHKPMPDDQSGFMRKNGEHWEIGINSLHHPNRQRFTLAHELGHYFLHKEEQANWSDKYTFTRADEKSDPMEWEANRFAAEFLMPERKFRELVANGTDNVDALAEAFQVSTMAVRIRAKNLGFRGHGLDD